MRITNAQFNLFYQYVLLLTKVKQFLTYYRWKISRCYSFSCNCPISYVNGYSESRILSLKYPHQQLLIWTYKFYMGSWEKLLKSKHLFFNMTLADNAADICVTMVSFCVRNFNIQSLSTKELFTNNVFWIFLKCRIVSDIYEHVHISIPKGFFFEWLMTFWSLVYSKDQNQGAGGLL